MKADEIVRYSTVGYPPKTTKIDFSTEMFANAVNRI